MDLSLEGRVAIVTGAGRGIGKVIAETFAQEGARVVVADINGENARRVASGIEARGGTALSIAVDISSREQVDGLMRQARDAYGTIDILVNDASLVSLLPLEEIDEAEWDRIMNVNLKGTFFCCQSVIPHMIEQKSGVIISMSGIAALDGGVVAPHYSISKAGIICLTKCFAKYGGRHGIRVNTVSPGPVETDMTKNWPESLVKTRLQLTPLGRFAKPEDVANVIVFLASDRARHITGENVIVDGGNLMR